MYDQAIVLLRAKLRFIRHQKNSCFNNIQSKS
jgi:hypothetical protein